ncbi:MAG: dihydroneopterin aldolase [Firmicutes bacterium]|nr:dihydroneopterin aldolase [Bacillota bacterium]
MRDRIRLHGMQFYGYHGVLRAEQSLGQPFVVDVDLFLDLEPAGLTDNLERTVDYARVFSLVEEIVTGRSYRLLEALAEAIAREILDRFPVAEVAVRVRKPRVPLPGIVGYAGVEIRRGREEGQDGQGLCGAGDQPGE